MDRPEQVPPVDPEEADGAEQAFEALRAEVAALRQGIAWLARQGQEAASASAAPDYSPTLGVIAKELQAVEARLAAVEGKPALAVTAAAQAAELRREVHQAGEEARRGLAHSQGKLDEAVRELREPALFRSEIAQANQNGFVIEVNTNSGAGSQTIKNQNGGVITIGGVTDFSSNKNINVFDIETLGSSYISPAGMFAGILSHEIAHALDNDYSSSNSGYVASGLYGEAKAIVNNIAIDSDLRNANGGSPLISTRLPFDPTQNIEVNWQAQKSLYSFVNDPSTKYETAVAQVAAADAFAPTSTTGQPNIQYYGGIAPVVGTVVRASTDSSGIPTIIETTPDGKTYSYSGAPEHYLSFSGGTSSSPAAGAPAQPGLAVVGVSGASYEFDTDANDDGVLDSQKTITGYSDGSYTVRLGDISNTQPWVSYTTSYTPSGAETTETEVMDPGNAASQVVNQYDINAGDALQSTTTYWASGGYQQTVIDTEGTASWQWQTLNVDANQENVDNWVTWDPSTGVSYTHYLYDPNPTYNSLPQYAYEYPIGLNGYDQYTYNNEVGQAGAQPWSSKEDVVADGVGITEEVVANPDGTWSDTQWSYGSQPWTELQYAHGPDNQLAQETVIWNNGDRNIVTYDPWNSFTWQEDNRYYDSSGNIYFDSTIDDDGWSVTTNYNYVQDNPNNPCNLVDVYEPGGQYLTYMAYYINHGPGYGDSVYAPWFFTQTTDWNGFGLQGGLAWADGGISDFNLQFSLMNFNPWQAINDLIQWASIPIIFGDFDIEIDPLVLNLTGGAVTTTGVSASNARFDIHATGTAQQMGWITPGEGFLALDKEGTGQVTSSHDLIADLHELQSYDSNEDGKIDANDSRFSDLRVWVPDSSGATGTLYTLAQLGITSISLAATPVNQDEGGNYISSSFSFTRADGTSGQGADVYFATQPEGGTSIAFKSGQGTLEISQSDLKANPTRTLAIEGGVDPSQVTVSGTEDNNIILHVGVTDQIVLTGALSGQTGAYGLQTITFDDGTSWSLEDVLVKATTGAADNLSLYGDKGANLFDSKGVATYEQGNGGGDTFVYDSGYGNVTIKEIDLGAGANNQLRFGVGIDPSQVSASVGGENGTDLILTDGVAGDQITLAGMLTGSQVGVQDIEFASGAVWTRNDLLSLLPAGTVPLWAWSPTSSTGGQPGSSALPILSPSNLQEIQVAA